jgi:hypothetical protein
MCDSENFGTRITDSELRVKRYGSVKFQGPICDFGKWLGLYLEILLNSRVIV